MPRDDIYNYLHLETHYSFTFHSLVSHRAQFYTEAIIKFSQGWLGARKLYIFFSSFRLFLSSYKLKIVHAHVFIWREMILRRLSSILQVSTGCFTFQGAKLHPGFYCGDSWASACEVWFLASSCNELLQLQLIHLHRFILFCILKNTRV